MTLLEIMRIASTAYPDGLEDAFDSMTGEPVENTGDMLARFIVNELFEAYDPGDTDQGQLEEAARVVNDGLVEIDAVWAALNGARIGAEVRAHRGQTSPKPKEDDIDAFAMTARHLSRKR